MCRFQYLALGYYLAHGACPESQQQGQDGNILSEESYDNWTEFFQRTSAALTLHTEAFRTAEVCMCSRQAKEPMQVHEQRTFTYQDVQVCFYCASVFVQGCCGLFAASVARETYASNLTTASQCAGQEDRAGVSAVHHRRLSAPSSATN